MRKKLKLRDCDLVCVVSVHNADIGNEIYDHSRFHISDCWDLVHLLLNDHIDFRVRFFESNDKVLDSFVSDDSCFVFGLIFKKTKLLYHPCSTVTTELAEQEEV